MQGLRAVLLLAAAAAAASDGHGRQPIADEHLFEDEFAVGGHDCPPSVRPVSKGLCNVNKCYAHAECQKASDGRRLCCYNGCVYSCMIKMPPPIVFDWYDEDSRERQTSSNETAAEEPWNSSTLSSSEEFEGEEEHADGNRAEANEAGHVIALPEGCILTKKDFEELLAFQRKDHVDVCYCKEGEVFCKVHGGGSKKKT